MSDSRCSIPVRAARAVLLCGWLPLVFYIPFDALTGGGGNPIGAGLLMVASTAVALLLLSLDALRLRSRRRATRKAPRRAASIGGS